VRIGGCPRYVGVGVANELPDLRLELGVADAAKYLQYVRRVLSAA
jgi:hypothetical protein